MGERTARSKDWRGGMLAGVCQIGRRVPVHIHEFHLSSFFFSMAGLIGTSAATQVIELMNVTIYRPTACTFGGMPGRIMKMEDCHFDSTRPSQLLEPMT